MTTYLPLLTGASVTTALYAVTIKLMTNVPSTPELPDWFAVLLLLLQIPAHRGHPFRRIADSVPVIADSF